MKTCTNKDCIHKGKPQKESNFHWDKLNVRRKTQCKDCWKEKGKKNRKPRKYENQRSLEQIEREKEAALFRQFDRLLSGRSS